MAHEDIIMGLMKALCIADKHTVGDYMYHKGFFSTVVSAVNNVYKGQKNLTDLKKLVQEDGYFRLPHIKSQYKDHAKALTKILTELLKYNEAIIHREKLIKEISLQPDALVLLKKADQGRCLIVEACLNETAEYLNNKIRKWEMWEGSLEYLSKLFGYQIPHYEFLIVGMEHPKSLTMEELCKR